MLNIFTGDYEKKSRRELNDIPLVAPTNVGARWQGIQHGKLVAGIIEALKELFSLTPLPGSEVYAVSPNGTAMIGGFSLGKKDKKNKVQPVYMTGIPQETYQSIGFQHSNDQRKALTVYAGGTVSLCSNGMVSAAHSFRHKHTTGLSLIEWLLEGLTEIWEHFQMTGEKIKSLFEYGVRPKDHDKLLLELGRKGFIPWRHLGEIDELWTAAIDGDVQWSPEWEWSFEQNAWDWYNAVTHVVKKIPPIRQLKVLEQCFNLTCDLLPKKDRPKLEFDRSVVDMKSDSEETS